MAEHRTRIPVTPTISRLPARWAVHPWTRAPGLRWVNLGVEFTQEPVARYDSVDAGLQDPSGNRWNPIEARLPRWPERG